MAFIILEEDKLLQRRQIISKMLKPITGTNHGPPVYVVPIRREFIFACNDGKPLNEYYRDWRFKTKYSTIVGGYFERWLLIEEGNTTSAKQRKKGKTSPSKTWYLERAYLHFYKLNKDLRDDFEYLCLHCDPASTDYNPEIYKQSPHIHIKEVNSPLSHAHIALNAGHLDVVLSSLENLMGAIATAIQMLQVEILDRGTG